MTVSLQECHDEDERPLGGCCTGNKAAFIIKPGGLRPVKKVSQVGRAIIQCYGAFWNYVLAISLTGAR
jgi:hypothetical protein